MNYKKYLLQRMNNKRQNKWTKSDIYSYSIPEDVISRLLQFHVDHILIEGSSNNLELLNKFNIIYQTQFFTNIWLIKVFLMTIWDIPLPWSTKPSSVQFSL